MKDYHNNDYHISAVKLTTLSKFLLFGFLLGLAWSLSQAIAKNLNFYIDLNNQEYPALLLCLTSFCVLGSFFYHRAYITDLKKVFYSKRIDLLTVFITGLLISIPFNGIFDPMYMWALSFFDTAQLFSMVLTPLIIGGVIVFTIWEFKRRTAKEDNPSFFISDKEKRNTKEDLLGFTENATHFAERVFNGGSSDSMVFGIDAPWGIGKSSFINFCEENWRNKFKDKIIVYKFHPLRYEDRSNLLDKFIDGLIRTIQKNIFLPEIRPLLSKYSRLIKAEKGTITVPGFSLDVVPGTYTVDDALDDLGVALSGIDKKVLIIVDDLDRLNFTAIKDVLFAIKKSFNLPNVSYILCYDTENIVALEDNNNDPEKITEFLEKFVNVKVSLYLDSGVLEKYVSENLSLALIGNSQADPVLVSKAVGGLIEIYKSPDYHDYISFIGDVRKIKRFLNILLLLEVEKTDFENSDFNKQDLTHLILIYINYPHIFRKIYNTETRGKRGFFSVVIEYDDNFPPEKKTTGSNNHHTFENSTLYTEYLKTLEPRARFLLDKVFNPYNRLVARMDWFHKVPDVDNVPEEVKRTYACFNGGPFGGGTNLEEYLNLIIKLSKPQKRGQYNFYLNIKNLFLKGRSLEELLSGDEFESSKGESSHEQFWRIMVNSLQEIDNNLGAKLITYLLNNTHNYSLFTNKVIGLGLRDDIDFFLVKLLDVVGWSDQNGKHQHNREENLGEIADWIFGEGKHKNNGVLSILSSQERGILGFYDLVAFRLFCSADRGGSIFNLQRSLTKHGGSSTPAQGRTTDIAIEEMREISQKTFKIFKDQYIQKNKNLFTLANSLTLEDFASNYSSFVKDKIKEGVITQQEVDKSIAELRTRVSSLIIYQLANMLVEHGVGCGFYDEAGNKDEKGIAKVFNKYLFSQCFNPLKGEQNYEYFLDYLLTHFASVFATETGKPYIPSVVEFTKVLDRKMLADYWKKHAKAIKDSKFTEKDKKVYQGNYIAFYSEDLKDLYKALDELVKEVYPPKLKRKKLPLQ